MKITLLIFVYINIILYFYIRFKKQNFKVDAKVAKKNGNDTYYVGIIRKVKDDKSLVHFQTRGVSRWCSNKNLEIIKK